MKLISTCSCATILLATGTAFGQGTFVYDQQSVFNDSNSGSAYAPITESQPFGQSFTPALANVAFIRLFLGNGVPLDPGPATLYINLRADSITGPILSSTQPVILAPGFQGPATFLFDTPVAVTPGVMYYFQPVVGIGNIWDAAGRPNTYPGGTIFGLGISNPALDLWFREGIVVPEPSCATFFLVAAGTLIIVRRRAT
jgi:hypothetical protein